MNLQIWCGLQWEKSRSDSWIKEKSAGGKSRHFLHFYIIQTNIIIFPTLQTEAAWNSSQKVEADALIQMSVGSYFLILISRFMRNHSLVKYYVPHYNTKQRYCQSVENHGKQGVFCKKQLFSNDIARIIKR